MFDRTAVRCSDQQCLAWGAVFPAPTPTPDALTSADRAAGRRLRFPVTPRALIGTGSRAGVASECGYLSAGVVSELGYLSADVVSELGYLSAGVVSECGYLTAALVW